MEGSVLIPPFFAAGLLLPQPETIKTIRMRGIIRLNIVFVRQKNTSRMVKHSLIYDKKYRIPYDWVAAS
jgi:hypothetical protein